MEKVLQLLKGFADKASELFFPPRCACCDTVMPAGYVLCDACERALIEEVRIDTKDISKKALMNSKISFFRSFDFDSAAAPFWYLEPVSKGLKAMKFYNAPEKAEFFAKEMLPLAERLKLKGCVDTVVFVPLSPKRKKKRGYDQALLLAEPIAEGIGLPLVQGALTKVFDSPEQHKQQYYRRFGNVFAAYEADEALCKDKSFLLIDDIVTTGATLNECAKMLKIAGAKQVHCLCAACAISRESPDDQTDSQAD